MKTKILKWSDSYTIWDESEKEALREAITLSETISEGIKKGAALWRMKNKIYDNYRGKVKKGK